MSHDKALAIRTVNKDRRAHGGFQWPESGRVEAPDWRATKDCGHGLHGLLDGIGDYGMLALGDPTSIYQVVEVEREKTIDLEGKVKFPFCTIKFSGRMADAFKLIIPEIHKAARANPKAAVGYRAPAATSGNYASAATSGNRAPAATSGNYAPAATSGNHAPAATSGNYAPAATSGYRAPAATSGNYAPAATSGNRAPAATSGAHSVAAALGRYGTAKAGPTGAIVLVAYNDDGSIAAGLFAKVGQRVKGVVVKADVAYRLTTEGKLEAA